MRHLLPLSNAQLGIWFAQLLNANKSLYNIGETVEFLGPIDPARFEAALRRVVAATDALHLRFIETEEGPRQFIERRLDWALPVVDFGTAPDPRAAAESWMRAAMDRVVDLAAEPPFDFALLRIAADRYIWYSRYHHLCTDGFGISLIGRRVAEQYSAAPAGIRAEAPKYGSWLDLLERDRAYGESPQYRRDREFWRSQLAERPDRMTIAGSSPSWPDAYLRCTCDVPRSVVRGLRRLASLNRASLSQVFTSAAALYVQRSTGMRRFALGTALTARPSADMQRAVGMVSNVLPLALDIDPDEGIPGTMRQIARSTLDAQLHQRYRCEHIRRDLGLDPAAPEIFGPIVNVCSFDYRLEFAGTPIRARNIGNWRVDDLEIVVYDRQDDADVPIDFCANPRLYAEPELAAHQQRFLRLLDALASAGSDFAVSRWNWLAPGEERQLLETFNAAPAEFPQDQCLHTLFEQRARCAPDAVAVISGEERLTYRQLNAQANRLAHHLIERGVKPDTIVALCADRSTGMLVGLLAILKAGGAYLPIDPTCPAKRIDYLLQDSGASLVVTQQAFVTSLPDGPREVVAVDAPEMQETLARRPESNPATPDRGPEPSHLAYVIYTSGSTGRPKGVLVEHRNVTRLFDATRERFEPGPDDVWTLFHSFSFDFSVWEIWGALLHGGSLVIVPYRASRSPDAFHALLRSERVTVLNQTPSAFLQLMAEDAQLPRLDSLRTVIFGGEALDPAALAPWVERYGDERPQLVNMYGITETTVHVTYRRLYRADILGGGRASVIGRPLPDLSLWVLDGARKPAPIGVPGEMYVGGAGLARGYLNRPELTAERFIEHPFTPGKRLYRTGDLARCRADGELEYLGRIDQQVKISGFRIETGEIEAELERDERVQDAFVTVVERGGQSQLAGYVVARAGDGSVDRTQVGHWQEVYESTYARGDPDGGDFDIVGWNSSYTGEPIPAAQMRLWVEEQIERIRALRPRRVLEIGCGTGLLLTRLAPACERYIGIDFSEQALARLRAYLDRRADLAHVTLHRCAAHELSFIDDDSVDLVILNSVVQYFPGIDYLLDVLKHAARVTGVDGHVVVGDVRNLALADAYHTSVQLCRAAPDLPIERLRGRIDTARANEEELLIDPALFAELCRRHAKLGRAELSPKLEQYDNELSRFRYEAVLRVGPRESPAAPKGWIDWDADGAWRTALRQALAASPGAPIGIRGILDRRSSGWIEAARLLHDADGRIAGMRRARDLEAAVRDVRGEGLDEVAGLARELGVALCWQALGTEGAYTAVFNARWEPAERLPEAPASHFRPFANRPATRGHAALGRSLESRLRESLPEYMVPRTIVVLNEWPLTANGKLDRAALPAPTVQSDAGERARSYRPPRTPTEQLLEEIWADILGVERVGIDDSFFDLGGSSLLAMQLFTRVKKSFGRNLPMATLFEAPTIERMARTLLADETRGTWASLRAIKPDGSKPPLFLVPGIGGNVVGYHDLAQRLGPEQPVYGLQSRGLDGVEKPIARMRDIAASFVREIRSVQPHGPYFLGGACIGGVVAFEMAQQLVASGERVALLALLETWPPSVHRAAVIPAYVPPFLTVPVTLGKGLVRLARALPGMRPGRWLQHARSRLESAREIIAQRNVYEADTRGMYSDLVSRSNYWAMFRYFPRSYPGKIVLFLCSDRPVAAGHDARLYWRQLAQESGVHYVGGKDLGVMLARPYVEQVGRVLRHEIELAGRA